MKNSDRKIKELIQSVEKEIPFEVEERFINGLDRLSHLAVDSHRRIRFIFKIALATAASLILAVLIFSPDTHSKREKFPPTILVESAKIEGKTASTFIFKETNPELTIVWIEKTGEDT